MMMSEQRSSFPMRLACDTGPGQGRPDWDRRTSPEGAIRDWRDVIGRVRAEYREMPGLCLTVHQACRLWQVDPTACTRILEGLVAERFLTRTLTGVFVRFDSR
jgi:hypothetical protein